MLTSELVQNQVDVWCRAEGLPGVAASYASSTVVLSGSVPTLRHAHLLKRELLQHNDVRSVVTSALEIEPRRDDTDVLKDAQAVLAGCACARVRLDVFDGVVSLTGDEPDSGSLQLLEDQLSGIPGVVDIRSTVTFAPPLESFDRESQTAPPGA
ncbi:MAG: BON domain-containing protein [Polyangiaceae bacterium]|nr:BON domain-containing protein [Myxococcales bacterium]MCB9584850.1 BON domain-containing protein [Polyangiaceae bacterium]MCB9607577.1 BON domain-containing protein [Polyangiaceae bacterium]